MPVPSDDLATILRVAAHGRDADAADRQQLLSAAVRACAVIAPDSMGCSITEMDGPRFRTSMSSGDVADTLDQLQYRAGAGPCIGAARDRQRHIVNESGGFGGAGADFVSYAADNGVGSVLSVPLPGTHRPSGLNLYAAGTESFTSALVLDRATLVSRVVAAIITGLHPASTPRDDDVVRRRGLLIGARHAVARARGMSEDAAFDWLILASKQHQRSIFDVAADVLQEGVS